MRFTYLWTLKNAIFTLYFLRWSLLSSMTKKLTETFSTPPCLLFCKRISGDYDLKWKGWKWQSDGNQTLLSCERCKLQSIITCNSRISITYLLSSIAISLFNIHYRRSKKYLWCKLYVMLSPAIRRECFMYIFQNEWYNAVGCFFLNSYKLEGQLQLAFTVTTEPCWDTLIA